MIPAKININCYVYVKLTDTGTKKFVAHYAEYGIDNQPYIDSSGWTKLQLWELMRIYGDTMFLGNPNIPFETEIIFDLNDIND